MAVRTYDIPELQELRFELEKDEEITVRLVSGTAEIFGYELAKNAEYPFGNECRGAIFSFDGAQLEIKYIAQESPVPSYLNLHLALERQRIQALPPKQPNEDDGNNGDEDNDSELRNGSDGPRVMILGEKSGGKSSLAKSLINWAIKGGRVRREKSSFLSNTTAAEDDEGEGSGRGVLLVNLDVGNGGFSVPGSLSMGPIYSCIPTATPVHAFGTTYATGQPPFMDVSSGESKPNVDTLARPINALSFYYGHTVWAKNETYLTDVLLPKAGRLARAKLEQGGEEGLWRGGMMIDAPTELADKSRTVLLQKIVRWFGVNILLVVGNEKLNLDVKKAMSTNATVTVIRVPKNEGASETEYQYRRRVQAMQIHSYFYGGPALSYGILSPHSMTINFAYLKIYRVGSEIQVPKSALPALSSRAAADVQLVEVDPNLSENTASLMNMVIALLQVEDDAPDSEKVSSAVLGYIHISGVDVGKKKFTVLSPVAGRIPRRTGIVGTLDWQDG